MKKKQTTFRILKLVSFRRVLEPNWKACNVFIPERWYLIISSGAFIRIVLLLTCFYWIYVNETSIHNNCNNELEICLFGWSQAGQILLPKYIQEMIFWNCLQNQEHPGFFFHPEKLQYILCIDDSIGANHWK